MTSYSKATNFAAKDALLTGNPSKVVKGTEIDAEFTAIQAADATSLKNGEALGTPSGGTLTNCTGLPVSTGISGLGTGVATFLATPSSANLASAVTGETGSGALVFATSPTLVTPALGTPSSGTLTNCTGLPSTGLTFLQAGTGATSRTGQAKLRDVVSVKDFGAVGDGVTDDRAAFALAITYCTSLGKTLFLPSGNYVIDTDGGSLTLEYVNILGEGVLDGSATPTAAGSVLSIIGTTNPPFLMRRGVTFDGVAFYYPNQSDSATPVVYPPTIQVDVSDGAVQFCYIRNCTVFNAYRFFVDTDTNGDIGHIFIENNVIYGILTCFELSHNQEVLKFTGNNFTFGAWLAATEAGCRGYTRANGTVMKIIRTDGFVFQGNMAYGYLNGIKFDTSATVCQLMNIENNLFDQVLFPIVATGTGNLSGAQIVGNSFIALNSQSTSTAGNAISISTSGSLVAEVLTITGNSFSTTTREHIIISGNTPTREILISGNSFTAWAAYVAAAGPYGALNISGSSTSFRAMSNLFLSQNASYTSGVVGSCSSALIASNSFGQCVACVNASYTKVSLQGNQSYSTGGATSDILTATSISSVGNLWDKPSGTTTIPAFSVRKAASQTTSGTTPAVQVFGTTVYDRGSNFSSTTFTAPAAGRYNFLWSLFHDNTGTAGDRFSIVLLTSTGAALSTSYKMIADYNTVTGGGDMQLASGTTVTLVVTRVGGTGVFNTFNDGNYNYLCGSLVE